MTVPAKPPDLAVLRFLLRLSLLPPLQHLSVCGGDVSSASLLLDRATDRRACLARALQFGPVLVHECGKVEQGQSDQFSAWAEDESQPALRRCRFRGLPVPFVDFE